MIKSKNIHAKTPAKYVVVHAVLANGTSDNTNNLVGVWPYAAKGKLVDLVYRMHAGGDATTLKYVAKKNNTTALCSTDAIFTVSDGAASLDSKGELTKPTNATRQVLSTTAATVTFSKGDALTVDVDRTGGTATGVFSVDAIFEAQE
jgi:hypothetical protein